MILAIFTRDSVAYKQDGSQVANNVPRYETGKVGQAIMIGEGTTNLCPSGMATATDLTKFITDPSVTTFAIDADRVHCITNGTAAQGFYTTEITVSANTVYSGGVTLTGSGTVDVTLRSYTAGGSAINTKVAAGVVLSATRQRIKVENFNTGASAAYVRLIIRAPVAAAIDVYADEFQVEAKTYSTSFIDGTRVAESLEVPLSVWKREPPFAIECRFWYDPTQGNPSDGRRLFSCTESGGFNISIANSAFVNDLSAWVHTGGAYQTTKTPLSTLLTGWNDVALVVLPTAVKLYVNGVLKDQKTGTFTTIQWPAPASQKLFIGAENAAGVAGSNWLNNLIDEIIFLDAAETVAKYV